MDDNNKICGKCLLCTQTYLGCECRISDNTVEYERPACIDFIKAEEDQENG